MYKTYFIQLLFKWPWIFRKTYDFLEDPQFVTLMYLAVNGLVVFY